MFGVHMDCAYSQLVIEGQFCKRNYRKMTISWSFSYNSFVKSHGEKWDAQHVCAMSESVL